MADVDEVEPSYEDHIASRTQAYTELAVQVNVITDKELRGELMLMLRAVRMSFKTAKQGDAEIVTRMGQPVSKL